MQRWSLWAMWDKWLIANNPLQLKKKDTFLLTAKIKSDRIPFWEPPLGADGPHVAGQTMRRDDQAAQSL